MTACASTHLQTVLKPQYSLAISMIRCSPRRFSVVPHVLRMSRCGATNSDDSLQVMSAFA